MGENAQNQVLAALDMQGLQTYQDALFRVVDVLLGVDNTPRAVRVRRLLDDELNRLYVRADAVAEEVEHRLAMERYEFTSAEWEDSVRIRFRQAERTGDLQKLVAALAREGYPPSDAPPTTIREAVR